MNSKIVSNYNLFISKYSIQKNIEAEILSCIINLFFCINRF